MKYEKALVTGGAGFIGSYIVEGLIEQGLSVTVLDDCSTGNMENVDKRAKIVQGDVCDVEGLSKLVADVGIIFHQAAKVSIRNSVSNFYDDARVNLMGTANVLKAVSHAKNVKKLVYASSMGVYGEAKSLPIREDHPTEPLSPYGIGKLASEKYCLQIGSQCGFDVIILRYFNTFGLRQALSPYVGVITIFINRILEDKPPIIFGNGEQIRDFVFVEDVARANILAMESDIRSGIFNIGSGKGTNVNGVARMILEKLNPGIMPEYGPQQPGEVSDSIADISRAVQMLNFAPTTSLEEKIGEVIDWWKHRIPGG